MSAFFFGPSGRQLFGFYHAPRGESRGAAVICPSWGAEYQYAHRALRVAAKRLAERGVHVLRFDYSGTGDSWGDTTDASLDRWQEDTALAVDELRAMSGDARVDLIGLRIGAFIAASSAAGRPDVRRVVLWDPVIDGAAWANSLNGGRAITSPDDADTGIEFAQRVVSPRLVNRLTEIEPAVYPETAADAVLVLDTQDASANTRELLSHVSNAQYRFVEDAPPWLEDSSIWSGLVPVKAVSAIVDWMVS